MEFVKLTFVLTRSDACALSCIAEQYNVTVPLIVRKIVQAEIRRREEALHDAEVTGDFTVLSGNEKK